jgi:4-hydroxy-tetrahydrodipicolinate reductase
MAKQVVILGAGGRMGGALVRGLRAGAVPGLELAGAVDVPSHPGLGEDVGTLAGAGATGVPLTAELELNPADVDVLIDFSTHQGAKTDEFSSWTVPAVIGSTGLTAEQHHALAAVARSVPVVMAPNMSLGINLLLSLVKSAATTLRGKGYDIEIVERHHRMKQDAPSGTALALGQAAAQGAGVDLQSVAAHGRAGNTGIRPEEQIGFHAIRGGDFAGDHSVIFAATGECIELSHRATSRDTFALGALRAAAWVAEREPGLYSMRDVLGL